jgi:hypothetical protein
MLLPGLPPNAAGPSMLSAVCRDRGGSGQPPQILDVQAVVGMDACRVN